MLNIVGNKRDHLAMYLHSNLYNTALRQAATKKPCLGPPERNAPIMGART